MQKFISLALLFVLLISCNKELSNNNDPIEIGPDDTILSTGEFSSGAHTTSGTAKLIQNKDGSKFLILENLKSDSGPDLRIYLSTAKNDNDFTEITKEIVLGNSKIAVPESANTDTQTFVLIWCKQFSVLFGSAELK